MKIEFDWFTFKLIIICLISVNVWSLKSDQIIGGDGFVVNNLDFGYHVTIVHLQKEHFSICGGSIVAEQYAVTAAHCVINKDWALKLYVVPPNEGTENIDGHDLSRYHKVTTAFVHSDYDFVHDAETRDSDIGVVKIEGSFLNRAYPGIRMLRLPERDDTYVNKRFIILGAGNNKLGLNKKTGELSHDFGTTDEKLRATKYKMIPYQKTSDTDFKMRGVFVGELGPDGILSDGDSGAGLVYNNHILVGVFTGSSKYKEGVSSKSDFVNIWHYVDAIRKIINGEIPKDFDVKVYVKDTPTVQQMKTKHQFLYL